MRMIMTALLLMAPYAGVAAAQDTTQTQRRNQDTTYQQQRRDDGMNRDMNRLDDEAVLMKMHKTNLMEVRVAQLAQRNGSSAKVKSLAQRLVRDHQAADQKVMTVAQQIGVTLKDDMDSTHMGGDRYGRRQDDTTGMGGMGRRDTIGGMGRRDTIGGMGRRDTLGGMERNDTLNRGGNRTDNMYKQGQDTTDRNEHARMARLATLRGAAYDSAFASAMVEGHDKAISMLQRAENQVQRAELRTLISQTLPTLREHLRLAQALPGGNAPRTTSSIP